MSRTLPALAALLLAAALLAPGGAAWAAGMEMSHGKMSAELAPADIPQGAGGNSIYQLGSKWRDDHGALVPIGALQGRPVVLAMVYTSCEHACPVIVEDLKRIEAALTPEQRKQVTVALFSFDPERDTPAVLAAYRAEKKLPEGQWRLFTGDPDEVLELAVTLGVQYKPDGFGGFAHSNLVTLLDADGVVRTRLVGLRADPAPLLSELRSLLGG